MTTHRWVEAVQHSHFTLTYLAPAICHPQLQIKVMNPPRPGKKCLVLDIDYTLFDHRSTVEVIFWASLSKEVELISVTECVRLDAALSS